MLKQQRNKNLINNTKSIFDRITEKPIQIKCYI